MWILPFLWKNYLRPFVFSNRSLHLLSAQSFNILPRNRKKQKVTKATRAQNPDWKTQKTQLKIKPSLTNALCLKGRNAANGAIGVHVSHPPLALLQSLTGNGKETKGWKLQMAISGSSHSQICSNLYIIDKFSWEIQKTDRNDHKMRLILCVLFACGFVMILCNSVSPPLLHFLETKQNHLSSHAA